MGERDGTDKQQFNVYLPPQLVRKVKLHALDHQQSLSDFVRDALEAYLKQVRNRK